MKSLLSLPALPKPGQRLDLQALAGSADALVLAQLADGDRMLAVITASPLDAQRLQEEIAWFAPQLRVHLLPDWETLPYDNFSPHQDLISERLATLYEITRGACDRADRSGHDRAGTRLAPPSFLAATPSSSRRAITLDVDKLREQLTLAGYQHVTQVVAAGRVQRARRADRPVPDGLGPALPHRAVRRRSRDPAHLRRRLAAHALPGAGDTPAAGARVPDRRSRPHAVPPALPRDLRGRCVAHRPLQGRLERHPPAGIEYYLPLFFDATATLFDYLPKDTVLCQHRDIAAAAIASSGSRHGEPLQDDLRRPLAAGDAAD
jgi:transcription-repair coupling factor (superfamily II helicase)